MNNRIEEIGRKIARYKKWNVEDKVVDYYNNTHLPEFIADIQYLLSKLEIAEKELQWTFEREGWIRTEEVLKSIRED